MSPSVVNGAARLVIVTILIAAAYVGRDLLIPLSFAAILSFILFPVVRWLSNWRVPHVLGIAMVMGAVIGGIAGTMTLLGKQAAQLLDDLPNYEMNLRNKAQLLHSFTDGVGTWHRALDTLDRVQREISSPDNENKPLKIEVASSGPVAIFLGWARSTLPSIATAGLVLILTAFMLFQYGDLRDRSVRLLGAGEIGRSVQALNEAGSDLATFFMLNAGLNACFGVTTGVALWLIGVPSPALWGSIAALMRFVPYVGAIIAALFPAMIAAMIDPGWTMLVETAGIFLVSDIICGQFIEPLLFGYRTSLSPIAVLFSTALWTLLWGPVGLVLAVPLTLTIVVIGQHFPQLEFLHTLLGNEPALGPPERLYRQFLAGDLTEAMRTVDRCVKDEGFVRYFDEILVPALRLASNDHHRGIINQEDELHETLDEYKALLLERLESTRQEELSRMPAVGPVQRRRVVAAVVIAGRGIFDQTAADLITHVVRRDLMVPVVCPSPGGLTGISAAIEATQSADIVAVVSVGEATLPQIDLLIRRAKRAFGSAEFFLGWFGQPEAGPSWKDDQDRPVRYVKSAGQLLDAIGHTADRIVHSRVDIATSRDNHLGEAGLTIP